MPILSLDNALWVLGAVGEFLLLGILCWQRQYRIFPVFTALTFWLAITDPILMLVIATKHPVSSPFYLQAYYAVSCVEYLLELLVLVEIAANVIRPVRKSLPRSILFMLMAVMSVVGLAAFIMAAQFNSQSHIHLRIFLIADTTVAILRLTTFLIILGFSQVVGLGWKNHLLQLASGLAFYAAVRLVGELAQSHLRVGPDYWREYTIWGRLQLMGYLCALFYWCWSFARQEAPRKEFSPQMTHFLVSISGAAKRQKAALVRSHDK